MICLAQLKDCIKVWSNARDRGEMPPPFVFRNYGAERPPLSTWNAVRQAQLPELMRANLLYELGLYYNEIAGWGERLVRYSEFTEPEVLPLLKMESSVLYAADHRIVFNASSGNLIG